MPDPDPATIQLDHRLSLSLRDWLQTDATLAALVFRRRDEDGPITPENQAKIPRLMVAVVDEGRTKPYAPIRTLRATITLRANSKVTEGLADAFGAACGAVENLLDITNLKVALDSPTYKCRVMHAARVMGNPFRVEGDNRFQSFVLQVHAVKAELTTDG